MEGTIYYKLHLKEGEVLAIYAQRLVSYMNEVIFGIIGNVYFSFNSTGKGRISDVLRKNQMTCAHLPSKSASLDARGRFHEPDFHEILRT